LESIKQQYLDFINSYQVQKDLLEKKIRWISSLRLLSFILLVAMVWRAFSTSNAYYWFGFVLVLILFLFLLKFHGRLFSKKSFVERLITINREEIKALLGDYSSFAKGEEYEIPYHDFSLDLDVFGNASLFQMADRTSSLSGSQLLAAWFNNPLLEPEQILRRQKAVVELASLIKFRQFFRARGINVNEVKEDFLFIKKWKEQKNLFYPKRIFHILIYLFPLVNALSIGLYAFDIIEGKILAAILFLSLLLVGLYTKKINKIHQNLSKRTALLRKYILMLQLVEKQDFSAPLLRDIKANIHIDGVSASGAIKELSKILSALDTRLNVFAGILMNALFIWDIKQLWRMEKWKTQYAKALELWISSLAQIDALSSLANLSCNNPSWVLPEISAKPYWYFSEARHPLMDREKCVPNDFIVKGAPHIKVITGANMAGKSTYLRTIGSNLLLAMIGSVVNAKTMTFFPIQIVSSLRTTDSLLNNESYFYAEIKRLQMIVQRLKEGERLFVLLDEILKGTNSKDKEEGSKALLKQLIHLQTVGIIATHDLSLGKLSEEFGQWIENQCFEVDIVNDQLSFDYKIRKGIAQNMNASFLLHKMGIVN